MSPIKWKRGALESGYIDSINSDIFLTNSQNYKKKSRLKCLCNEIYAFFYSKLLKAIVLWFVVFEFGLRTSAYKFLLQLQSWSIWVKICDISCAVKTCKLVQWLLKVCKTFKPSWHLRRTSEGVGSFSLPESLLEGAAKQRLHRRQCLAFISERRSQNSTLWAICSDTPAQLRRMRLCCPSISNEISSDNF